MHQKVLLLYLDSSVVKKLNGTKTTKRDTKNQANSMQDVNVIGLGKTSIGISTTQSKFRTWCRGGYDKQERRRKGIYLITWGPKKSGGGTPSECAVPRNRIPSVFKHSESRPSLHAVNGRLVSFLGPFEPDFKAPRSRESKYVHFSRVQLQADNGWQRFSHSTLPTRISRAIC